jgi:hypothetical protein
VNLECVARFAVPAEAVCTTEEALRGAGADGYELFVLWSGRVEGERFVVRTTHVPPQTSKKTHDGLLVQVDGEALHRLNAWLYEAGEMLGVQVHAHPNDAYHSLTDDRYPIVTTLGGLSIVAERFCGDALFNPETAVYRLDPDGWQETDPDIIEVT